MCTLFWLHYHHNPPCNRAIEFAYHYSFCPNSTIELASTGPLSPATSGGGGGGGPASGSSSSDHQYVQRPCANSGEAPGTEDIDPTNPCATGGCLISQQCSSGGCRLEELGGQWTCCKCNKAGNTFRWCVHPKKKVPDALCYHVVCQDCEPDF
ncbi:hypothetical protein F4778DRAFT_800263 [Xylariomycetidae sp. FL2044]|nr:hypothetical protein F4778DRAFT_800263 [Xylariomycetidae sp. FL2044]